MIHIGIAVKMSMMVFVDLHRILEYVSQGTYKIELNKTLKKKRPFNNNYQLIFTSIIFCYVIFIIVIIILFCSLNKSLEFFSLSNLHTMFSNFISYSDSKLFYFLLSMFSILLCSATGRHQGEGRYSNFFRSFLFFFFWQT